MPPGGTASAGTAGGGLGDILGGLFGGKPGSSGSEARPGGSLTEASVRQHCEAFLTQPKMPKRIFIVSDLPKSDRGKVLRDRLRAEWIARTEVSA